MIFYELTYSLDKKDYNNGNYYTKNFKGLNKSLKKFIKNLNKKYKYLDIRKLTGNYNDYDYIGTYDPFTFSDMGY